VEGYSFALTNSEDYEGSNSHLCEWKVLKRGLYSLSS
jgi:hypothetical protein